MVDIQSSSDEFRGFDEARSIMWCHEARARIHHRLTETPFLVDPAVAAVHVENTSRVDRAHLTAFDRWGARLDADTLFVDDPSQRLDVTPEFDHDFTGMTVAAGSDLAATVAAESGWVIDMRALREYDLADDRRATQRAVFLAHLGDMMNSGQVQGFSLGVADAGESSEADAA